MSQAAERTLFWVRAVLRGRSVHDGDTTDRLERAIAAAGSMPPAMQDEVARVVLMLTGEDKPVVRLTPDEDAAFAASERAEGVRRVRNG